LVLAGLVHKKKVCCKWASNSKAYDHKSDTLLIN